MKPKLDRKHLHRIKQARIAEGVSLRAMARRLERSPADVKHLEESPDLKLSDLYRWQRELQVPLMELIDGPSDEPLSEPVRQRAFLIRVARTVNSLIKKADSVGTCRLATTLRNQLVELMPELEQIGAWPEFGQRRGDHELGRVAVRLYETNQRAAATDGLIEPDDVH